MNLIGGCEPSIIRQRLNEGIVFVGVLLTLNLCDFQQHKNTDLHGHCSFCVCVWGSGGGVLSTSACLHPCLCRILLCQGAVYQKWGRWGRRRAVVVQKERPSDGEGHGAGQHVGGHHAFHRASRLGAGPVHAAVAIPFLSVSHHFTHEPFHLHIRAGQKPVCTRQLGNGIVLFNLYLPAWSGGSWGSTQDLLDAHQQKKNPLNIL